MPSFLRSNRPHTLYAALILLTLAVTFGGASRYDVGSTIVPRLAALAAIAHLFWSRRGSPVVVERGGLIFWIAVIALPLLQLIPLPWPVWTALPGRGLARDVFGAIGEQPWQPISVSPDRTIEALLAMVVPLAAWLLGSHLDFAGRTIVLRAMLLLAVVSGILGLMQLNAGPGSPLYLYSVTNDDSAVGFFANANHMGLFMAGGIVITFAWLADTMATKGRIVAPAVVAAGLVIAVLLFAIAGTSSRAAAIFSVIALLGGLAMVPFDRIGVKRRYVVGGAGAIAIVMVLGLGLLLSGTVLSGRFQYDHDLQQRADLLPRFVAVARDFFPFGSGLGSFEPLFRSYEAVDNLSFGYWNQAHHDYAQLAIEGGLYGIALVLVFAAWFALRVWNIARRGDPSSRVRRQQWTAALVMLLVLLHSAGDYPMRTGAIAAVFAFLAAFLAAPRDSAGRGRRRGLGDEAFPGYERR